MKLVKTAIVTALIGALAFFTAQMATAQTTMPVKAPPAAVACPPTSMTLCNGWYVGAEVGGVGTASSVTANGVASNAYTAGGIAGADVGYQYWAGGASAPWLLAFEASFDYDATGTPGGAPGFFAAQKFRAGGALSILTGQPSPSQGPFSIGSFTNAIWFAEVGPAEKQFSGGPFATGWLAGSGFLLPLGGKWTAKAEYFHVGYNATARGITINSEDKVMLGANYHF